MNRSLRQLSTECKVCGKQFDEQNPKQPKRALCLECYNLECDNRLELKREERKTKVTKIELMQPFKVENRQEHWNKINKEIRKLKKLDEIHQFIKERADEVFANKELMEFINHQN
jgi:hypothetical protein